MLPPSPVRATRHSFSLVTEESVYCLLHSLGYLSSLFSWHLEEKVFVVLEANSLVPIQELLLPLSEVIEGSDPAVVDLVCVYRTNSPNLAQLLQEDKLGIDLKILELRQFALRDKLFHLLLDSIANIGDIIHLLYIGDWLWVGLNICDCSLVAPTFGSLCRYVSIHVHEFGQLGNNPSFVIYLWDFQLFFAFFFGFLFRFCITFF